MGGYIEKGGGGSTVLHDRERGTAIIAWAREVLIPNDQGPSRRGGYLCRLEQAVYRYGRMDECYIETCDFEDIVPMNIEGTLVDREGWREASICILQ